jgi:hypothetical protein
VKIVPQDLSKITERFRAAYPSHFLRSELGSPERAAGVSAPQFRLKAACISLEIILNEMLASE